MAPTHGRVVDFYSGRDVSNRPVAGRLDHEMAVPRWLWVMGKLSGVALLLWVLTWLGAQ